MTRSGFGDSFGNGGVIRPSAREVSPTPPSPPEPRDLERSAAPDGDIFTPQNMCLSLLVETGNTKY